MTDMRCGRLLQDANAAHNVYTLSTALRICPSSSGADAQ
jgi:hypothetical protein